MIWKIARKELLSNLLTFRFTVGTALLLVLTVLFSSILLSDYHQSLEEYNKFVSKNDEDLRQIMTYQNISPSIYKPPEVLTLFSKGIDDNVANSVQISVEEIPSLTSASSSKNPLLSVFSVLDVALVFKLVISVLAFLLAYDAISGEKEDGTLRLMLSNKVPRYQLLFGKFLGGMLTLAIPLILGFLIAIMMMEFSPMIKLRGGEWLRVVLMFVVSLLMVSAFFNIGLFISSLTKRASDTLMLLLFIWVAFLLIIPNASSYLATRIRPIESGEKINASIQEIRAKLIERAREIFRQNPEEGIHIESDETGPLGSYIKFATRRLIRRQQKINQLLLPLRIEFATKVGELNRTYLESLISQKKIADGIAEISPISVYEKLMSSLSRTDFSTLENFSQQAKRYRQQVIDYLNDKNAFSSIRYFSTVKEEHLFDVNNSQEYMELYRKYANYEPRPLDLSGLPRFRYLQEGASSSLRRTLPDLLILTFMGIFFFICAFVAVLRYDVR